MSVFHRLPKRFHPDFRIPGKKPVGPIEIDWSNPLARGLVAAPIITPNGLIDPVGVADWQTSGTPVIESIRGIYGLKSSVNRYLTSSPVVRDLPTRDEFTIMFRAMSGNAAASAALLGWSGGDDIVFYPRSTSTDNSLRVFWRDKPTGSSTAVAGTQDYGFRCDCWLGMAFDASADIRGYTHGKEISVKTGADAARGSFSTFQFGSWEGQTDPSGYLIDVMFWDRKLSAAEVAEFTRNPYQIFKPVNDYGYFIPSSGGGGGATLTADSGSFVQTGTDTDLHASRMLSAAGGSYTALASAVNLLAGRIVNASGGGYTLTGQDANLLKQAALVLNAESGNFALSTTAVELLFNRVIPTDTGTFLLTGQNVTLSYAAGSTLIAGQGDFLSSGADVALIVDRKMNAATGSLTAVHNDAGLFKGYVANATGGDLTLTGQELNTLLDRAIQAGAASFNANGTPVVLLYSGVGQFPDLEGEITLVSATPKITLQSKTPKITIH